MPAAEVIELPELPYTYKPHSSAKAGPHGVAGADGDVTIQELREVLQDGREYESAILATQREVELEPVDRGFGAWSYLAAAFMVESLVWGFPNGYGAFLANYLNDPELVNQKHGRTLLPLVGPLASGIMYCASPITYPIAGRYPRYRRRAMWVGIALIFISLFGASYTREVKLLIALQGVVYSIGGSLIYAPCIYYMSEWFVERRGLANGTIDAGTAVGGLVLPLILPSLLQKYGSSRTLRGLSLVELFALCAAMGFVKGRLPESRVHGPAARSQAPRSWLKDRVLLVIVIANTLQGLAFFVPVLWLPTYASSLHLSATSSSLSLALLNGASVFSRLGMGTLSDMLSPWVLAFATLVVASIATFVLWGVLSYTLPGVLAYGVVYGCFAGGWSSLWTGFVRPIAKDDPAVSTSIFGVLMFSRGIGNILSTPVSTALQTVRSPSMLLSPRALLPKSLLSRGTGYSVADGQYEKMIVYVGSCFAVASVVVAFGWVLDSKRRRT